MSQISVNGFPVASGEVSFPLRGAWSATVEVVAASAAELFGVTPDPAITEVGGDVELVMGSTTLVGYGTAGVDQGERVTVRIVAGAGGLGATVEPAHFVSQSRRVLLSSALEVGGEELSTTSTGIDETLGQWTRQTGTVGEAVQAVAAEMGSTWRHLPDGTVWIGTNTWAEVRPDNVLVREEPTQSRIIVAVEGAVVLPGSTFRGRRVTGVKYGISSGAIRATVAYGDARDPLAAALGTIVGRETKRLDFFASYEARVVGQNAQTLELQPSDPRLPRNMSRVPMRPGMAGVTSQTVPVGSTALVSFANGDPGRAYVGGFVAASATALTIDAMAIKLGELATAFAARADLVDAQFALVATAILAHGHASFGAAGAPLPGGSPYVPSSVACTKVLVE